MRARMYAMNKKMIIVLCCLIAVMTVIIVAGISYLYQGIETEVVESTEPVESTGTVEPSEPIIPTESSEPEPEKIEPEKAPVAKPSLPQDFKVTNCKTNKQNTLRQNKDNSLELIDESGKILWSIPFPGTVCGTVGEVDFYNNKKIQFLLCDGSSLHLIDRLGREVEGFPKPVGLVAINGPEKVQHKGVTYWKLDTESGPVYYNYKATKVITQLP